ncbi:MAG: DsbA family oxidoreductase [Bacteroidia bacterium]|nr:DsbA family oxidoreductase [Bacteroidia bacterium]
MHKPILHTLILTLIGLGMFAQDSQPQNLQTKKMIEIEIWSDVMCPFCYIGKRKFEIALQNFKHKEEVHVSWKSYLLDSGLVSDSSKSIHQHLAQSKGWTLDYAQEMSEYVSKMAKEVGLNYNMNSVKVANTFDAHRLIQFAKQFNKGSELEELLFKAYFCEGKNLADTKVLISIGESAGLNASELKNIFAGKDFSKEVLNDLKEAEDIGVSGVPFFVFNRKFAVSGAQDSKVFLDALQKTVLKTGD